MRPATSITCFNPAAESVELDALCSMWGRSANDHHAFFPWTPDLLSRHIITDPGFDPAGLFLARVDGRPVGFAHASTTIQPSYEPTGSIEMITVDPDLQGSGIGQELVNACLVYLRRSGIKQVDAMGAWPFGPYYTTLAGGSERSGVPYSSSWLMELFEDAGIKRARESIVMQLQPTAGPTGDAPVLTSIRKQETWLDYVFRNWQLTNHILVDHKGRLQSRAIYGRMAGQSDYLGKELYAVFGVNTPEHLRGKGYARTNLCHLITDLAEKGADLVELHVYADNTPAIRLYQSLGFKEVGRNVMMRMGV